jgi:hypothetical protein
LALKPFEGGQMVFFQDRVEICGIDICSGARSKTARRALDLLRQRRRDGKNCAYSGDELAETLGLNSGQNGAADVIRDLRDRYRATQ